MGTVTLIAGVSCLLLIAALCGGKAPKPYARRKCMGKHWKRAFPQASKHEIRAFLLLFADAFAFKPVYKLQFAPHDRILDIYNASVGTLGMDALELETLAYRIEREYHVDFTAVWSETLTLGDLFLHASHAQADKTQVK